MSRRAILLALAALGAPAAGCADDATLAGDGRKGGAVVVALERAPASVDPALATGAVERRLAWLAYTPPLTYRRAEGADGTELVPALATELPQATEDGRTYAFELRDARYPGGRRLRASDVERAIARSLRLSPAALEAFGGIVGARAHARGEGPGTDVAGIAVDDAAGTVEIDLERPDRLFPYALATTLAAPLPPGTPLRDLSRDPPPGIGPYRISQLRRSGDVVLERRRRWRLAGVPAGNPYEIVTRTVPERGRRIAAVAAGRVDVVEGEPPVRMLADLRSRTGDRYAEHVTLRTLYVDVDASREPFRAPEVRRALAYALDVGALARIYEGFMVPGCTVLPPALPGHRAPDPCPFGERLGNPDLVEASRLVGEAGATGAAVTVARGADRRGRALARHLTRALRKIGLRATVGEPARAQVGFAAARPDVPHPSAYLTGIDDPVLQARADLLAQQSDARDAAREWAEIDAEVVSRGYRAPYGVATVGVLTSARLDAENCSRFHPVVGIDYSSLCLR